MVIRVCPSPRYLHPFLHTIQFAIHPLSQSPRTVHHVSFLVKERSQQITVIRWIIFHVRVLNNDIVAGGVLQSGSNSAAFSAITVVKEQHYPHISSLSTIPMHATVLSIPLSQKLCCPILRSIVHNDDFLILWPNINYPLQHPFNRACLIIDRYNHT